MCSPKGAIGFFLPLLLLPILAISIWPTVFGRITEEERKQIAEHGLCTDPNIVHSYNYCYANCANREPGQCDSRGDKAGLTCQCKPGYILDRPRFYSPEPGTRFWDTKARCIKLEQCPNNVKEGNSNPESYPGLCNDPNTVHNHNHCYANCLNQDQQCDRRNGTGLFCQCKPGFILDRPRFFSSDSSKRWNPEARCVKLEECRNSDGQNFNLPCGQIANAELVRYTQSNYSHCHTTCANPEPVCDGLKDSAAPNCQCKEGYTWDKPYRRGGKCIKPEECHHIDDCEDPNIVYRPITCHEHKCNPSCKHPNPREREECGNEQCNKMGTPPYCVCRAGYVSETEDGMGKCVKLNECPKLCDSNEEYRSSCGDRSCSNKNEPPPHWPPEFGPGLACHKRCACKDGYVRREDGGRCVKEEQCPRKEDEEAGKKCGPNEELGTDCQPMNCVNRERPIGFDCSRKPAPRCQCQKGHIRTDEGGPCVKPEECPSLGLGEEEGNECGEGEEFKVQCHESSCLYKDVLHVSKPDCENPLAKCHCKAGYMRREEGGPCVKEGLCPPKRCGPNEEIQTSCFGMSCGTWCWCKAGYAYKEEGGPCVKQGPPPGLSSEETRNEKCGPNEHFQEHCSYVRTCQNKGIVFFREPDCFDTSDEQHCYCNAGYVRRAAGGGVPCVKEEECPPRRCGPNEEVYSNCGERNCANKDDPVMDSKHVGCNAPPKCHCQDGFVRRDEEGGPCVKEEECPSLCPSGELYMLSCEDKTCEDKDVTPPPNNPWEQGPGLQCGRRCACKPGQVRREKGGPCVREEDCPSEGVEACPSPDEERLLLCLGYKEPSCDGPKVHMANCRHLKPRCVCKQGFLRESANGQGPCVSGCVKGEGKRRRRRALLDD